MFHLSQKYFPTCFFLLVGVFYASKCELAHGLISQDFARIMRDWLSHSAVPQTTQYKWMSPEWHCLKHKHLI